MRTTANVYHVLPQCTLSLVYVGPLSFMKPSTQIEIQLMRTQTGQLNFIISDYAKKMKRVGSQYQHSSELHTPDRTGKMQLYRSTYFHHQTKKRSHCVHSQKLVEQQPSCMNCKRSVSVVHIMLKYPAYSSARTNCHIWPELGPNSNAIKNTIKLLKEINLYNFI